VLLHRCGCACTRTSCICSHLLTIALNRWFDKWAEYASFRRGTNGEPATVCSPLKIQHIAPRPGAIDNSPLLDAQGSNLREGLSEGQDFTVINKETWELLHKWCVEELQCATLHVWSSGHTSCCGAHSISYNLLHAQAI
jgi:DUSP domain